LATPPMACSNVADAIFRTVIRFAELPLVNLSSGGNQRPVATGGLAWSMDDNILTTPSKIQAMSSVDIQCRRLKLCGPTENKKFLKWTTPCQSGQGPAFLETLYVKKIFTWMYYLTL
jgi:hypothetical protein